MIQADCDMIKQALMEQILLKNQRATVASLKFPEVVYGDLEPGQTVRKRSEPRAATAVRGLQERAP